MKPATVLPEAQRGVVALSTRCGAAQLWVPGGLDVARELVGLLQGADELRAAGGLHEAVTAHLRVTAGGRRADYPPGLPVRLWRLLAQMGNPALTQGTQALRMHGAPVTLRVHRGQVTLIGHSAGRGVWTASGSMGTPHARVERDDLLGLTARLNRGVRSPRDTVFAEIGRRSEGMQRSA